MRSLCKTKRMCCMVKQNSLLNYSCPLTTLRHSIRANIQHDVWCVTNLISFLKILFWFSYSIFNLKRDSVNAMILLKCNILFCTARWHVVQTKWSALIISELWPTLKPNGILCCYIHSIKTKDMQIDTCSKDDGN